MKVRIPRCEDVLTDREKALIQAQIRKQFAEIDDQHNTDIDAMILYTLHQSFGWGAKRLRLFYDEFTKNFEELKRRYEMDDGCWLARQALLSIGVDIESWNRAKD